MTGFSTKKLLLITLFINFVAIAGVIIRVILLEKDPYRYFDEGSLINWLSGLQLLIIAGINWQIYNLRKASHGSKSKQFIWQFFAFGFVFAL